MADSRPATVVSQRPCQAEITEAVKTPQKMVSLVKDGTKVSHTSTHSRKKEITTSAGIQLELQLRECFATQQILRRVINFALFRFARHFKFLISQKTTT